MYFYEIKEKFPKPWLIQRYTYEEYRLIRIGTPTSTLQALQLGVYEVFRSLAENIKGIIGSGSRCNAYFAEETDAISQLWEKYFPFPCLPKEAFAQDPWVEILMQNAEKETTLPPDYVLYGFSEGIYSSLWARAGKIRSLTLVPLKRRTEASPEEFLEELEYQYGILTDVNPKPVASKPVTVLDFCRLDKSLIRVAEGSVWLDLYPISAKKRYIGDKMGRVNYISMPTLWKSPKSPQKSGDCLDTP